MASFEALTLSQPFLPLSGSLMDQRFTCIGTDVPIVWKNSKRQTVIVPVSLLIMLTTSVTVADRKIQIHHKDASGLIVNMISAALVAASDTQYLNFLPNDPRDVSTWPSPHYTLNLQPLRFGDYITVTCVNGVAGDTMVIRARAMPIAVKTNV